MRTSRRPVAVACLAFGVATLAVVASGCSVTSPKTTLTPYAASDGSNGEVGSVLLRNFLVVAPEAGKPGVVVGAATTNGASDVSVQFTVLDGTTSLGDKTVTVTPGKLTALGTGSGATAFTLDDVPVTPGAHLTLRASTKEGNRDLPLPVLATEGQYETITPTATAAS